MIDPQDMLWLQANIPEEDWENMGSPSLISKLLDYYRSVDGDLVEEEAKTTCLEKKIHRAVSVLEGHL